MPLRFAHAGDFHLDEDRYFADTAQCLEWFVADAIQANVDLFVINGDLTTYKATIKERNFWVDRLVEMANHAPVILVAGNHGAELEGDLYVFGRAKGKHPIYLCTDPQFIELGEAAIAVFPYPRKAVMADNEHSLAETFAQQLHEFNQQFEQRPGCYKLFFGHFGVAGARVSSGQPLVGRCAEYPLDPLRSLKAQYVGLSHIHLRQQLAPRIWYAGSLSRCDYSEVEDAPLKKAERPHPYVGLLLWAARRGKRRYRRPLLLSLGCVGCASFSNQHMRTRIIGVVGGEFSIVDLKRRSAAAVIRLEHPGIDEENAMVEADRNGMLG